MRTFTWRRAAVACFVGLTLACGSTGGSGVPDASSTEDARRGADARSSKPEAGGRDAHRAFDASSKDVRTEDVGVDASPRDAGEDSGKDTGVDAFVNPCSACTATEVCLDGGCEPCGGSGQPCCASGPACDVATLACASGVCTTCGGQSEPCCGGSSCGTGLGCSEGTCTCGAYGADCCTSGNACVDTNLTCASGTCTCGAIRQVCCATGVGGQSSACTPTGGAPATCAPGGECSCLKACSNSEIQRSDGTLWDPGATSPTTYDGLHSLIAASFSGSGNLTGCAVDGTGAAFCWGPNNSFGQLGNGTTSPPVHPAQAAPVLTAAATPLTSIRKVVVDGRQGFAACAIDTGGSLWCWGCPDFAQSGTYSTYAHKIVTSLGGPALSGVTDVSVGEFHTCAITNDGNLWCWGANDYGQLGTGDTSGTAQTYPVKVTYFPTNSLSVATASVGSSGSLPLTLGSTCASTTSGNVYCWGSNAAGALEGAVSATQQAYAPVEMLVASGGAPLASIASVQIITSNSSPCAVTTGGSVLCWGSMPKLASWPSPYYPSAYQEQGAFPTILSLCSDTGYGNAGTFGTTFLDANGIYHQGGMAYLVNTVPCAP